MRISDWSSDVCSSDLMIVVAIIAILAAIALPAYNQYRIRSAEGACQAEMKNYASFALTAIYNDISLSAPAIGACVSADTATDMSTTITGTPQLPGVRKTTCDMHTANCALNCNQPDQATRYGVDRKNVA